MFDIKQFIYPALEIAAIKNSILNNFKMLLLRPGESSSCNVQIPTKSVFIQKQVLRYT